MIGLSINLRGFSDLDSRFDKMSDRVTDFNPISRDLADIVRQDINLRFLSSPATVSGGVVYGNVYWGPLSPYTFRMNPRREQGKVHIDTGRLWQGAINEGGGGNRYYTQGSDFFFELTASQVDDLQNKYNRPIAFWHEELLNKVRDRTVEYVMEPFVGNTRR